MKSNRFRDNFFKKEIKQDYHLKSKHSIERDNTRNII